MKIPPKKIVSEPDYSGPVLQNEGEVAFAEGWNAAVEWALRGGELPHVIGTDGVCATCRLGAEDFPLTTGCCGEECDTNNRAMVRLYQTCDFKLGEWCAKE